MLTTETAEAIFIHSSDYSGDVTINDKNSDQTITLPVKDILEFVAECMRTQQAAIIEEASREEILAMAIGKGVL